MRSKEHRHFNKVCFKTDIFALHVQVEASFEDCCIQITKVVNLYCSKLDSLDLVVDFHVEWVEIANEILLGEWYLGLLE